MTEQELADLDEGRTRCWDCGRRGFTVRLRPAVLDKPLCSDCAKDRIELEAFDRREGGR